MKFPIQGTTGAPAGLPSPEAAECQILIGKPPAVVAVNFLEGSGKLSESGFVIARPAAAPRVGAPFICVP